MKKKREKNSNDVVVSNSCNSTHNSILACHTTLRKFISFPRNFWGSFLTTTMNNFTSEACKWWKHKVWWWRPTPSRVWERRNMWKTLESNRLAHIVHFHSNNRAAAQQQQHREVSPIYDLFFFLVFSRHTQLRFSRVRYNVDFSLLTLYRCRCKAWIKTTPKCLEMGPRKISTVVDFYFWWQILLCHSISIMLTPWTLPRRACSEVPEKTEGKVEQRQIRDSWGMKTSREKQNFLGLTRHRWDVVCVIFEVVENFRHFRNKRERKKWKQYVIVTQKCRAWDVFIR